MQDLTSTVNDRDHIMLNTFAQVWNDIFHQLFERRIVESQNKTNNTGSFSHLKMSEIPE